MKTFSILHHLFKKKRNIPILLKSCNFSLLQVFPLARLSAANSTDIVEMCLIVSHSLPLSTALSPLAANVVAAWRSGGGHYRLCGVRTSKFARNFLRSYTRHCAKPPVSSSLFSFFSFSFKENIPKNTFTVRQHFTSFSNGHSLGSPSF